MFLFDFLMLAVDLSQQSGPKLIYLSYFQIGLIVLILKLANT